MVYHLMGLQMYTHRNAYLYVYVNLMHVYHIYL